MEKNKKRFLIIDSNSIIHRAYHALPALTTKEGELVNVIYGFLLVFFKALKDFQPDFIAAVFDYPALTFRHKKYKEYKAKRPPTPKELYLQIPKVKEVLTVFGVPIFEKQGFEADDIIGTIAVLSLEKQAISPVETIILSGDSDAFQLINSRTKVCGLRKGIKDAVLYDEKAIKEKFQGLAPDKILDIKSLKGDASDNIPGVSGIGEKTAVELVLKFGGLENLYKEIEENTEKARGVKPKLKDILLGHKEQAFLSRDLAEIDKNVPIDFELGKCRWGDYDKEKIIKIFKKFEFHSLLNRLPRPDEKENKGLIGENLKLW